MYSERCFHLASPLNLQVLNCITETLHNFSLQRGDPALLKYHCTQLSLQGPEKGQEAIACMCPRSQLPHSSAEIALLLPTGAQGVSNMFPNPQLPHLIALGTLL